MARSKKRISRRDIRQPDQFMVKTGRLMELCRAYRRQLIIAGIAIGLVLGGIAARELYATNRNNKARVAYNRALDAYEAGRFQDALAAFRKVVSYGSTPHGELAGLYIGNAQLALGQSKEAIKGLQNLTNRIAPGTLTGQLALLTLALAQEMDNSCDAALGSLEQVVGGSGPFRQEALLAKARCSARVGEVDNAIKTYREYLKRFPGSDTPQISLKLQELEAKSAGG
jgi:hypothetical protein